MYDTVITLAVTASVVTFVIYRNVTWRAVTLAKLTRLPIIFAVIGAVMLASTVSSLGSAWRPSTVDITVLGGELVVAAGVGWAMGRLSEFSTAGGAVRSKLRPAGIVVFVAFIALRIVVALIAGSHGGSSALMSSSVMVMIAVVKLSQGLVIRETVAHHTAALMATHSETPVAAPQLSLR